MLFTVAAMIAQSALYLYLVQRGYESAVARDLSFFVVLPVSAFLMWPILRVNRPSMRHWFRPPVSWPALIAYSLLLGVLLRTIHWAWLTAGLGFGWFYNANFPAVATAQFHYSCPPASLLVLAVVVRAILTPLFEEFIHRGYVLCALLPRGKFAGIVLSAVFFGLVHQPNTIVNAFLIGLLLAILSLRLQTLWGPIIVHGTFNLSSIIDWNCLHANWNPAVTTQRHVMIGGISVVTLVVCLAMSLWLLRLAKTGTQLAPRS